MRDTPMRESTSTYVPPPVIVTAPSWSPTPPVIVVAPSGRSYPQGVDRSSNPFDDGGQSDPLQRDLRPSPPLYPSQRDAVVEPSKSFPWFGLLTLLAIAGGLIVVARIVIRRHEQGLPMNPLSRRSRDAGARAAANATIKMIDAALAPKEGRSLQPGDVLTIASSFPLIAEAAGSKVKGAIGGRKVVSAVGRLGVAGLKLERLYFDKERAFVEIARQGGAKIQQRLYVLHEERRPEDEEAWAFFLGEKDGLIGQPDISIPPDSTSYRRLWSPGDARIDALAATETIATPDATQRVAHKMMGYARRLDQKEDGLQEYLIIESARRSDGASIRLWIGLDLPDALLDTLSLKA